MKIRITKSGTLQIMRPGGYKDAYCPMVSEDITCGDGCALFGEPTPISNASKTGSIMLCKNLLTYEEIEDLRTGVKNDEEGRA